MKMTIESKKIRYVLLFEILHTGIFLNLNPVIIFTLRQKLRHYDYQDYKLPGFIVQTTSSDNVIFHEIIWTKY